MNVLFLTNNPNLGSTARILQCWLTMTDRSGVRGCVVAQQEGDFPRWLRDHHIDTLVDPMPWPSLSKPFSSLHHLRRVARWAKQQRIDVIHCNEHNVYPFAVWLRKLLGRPLVVHIRFKVERPFCEWTFAGSKRPDALLWTSQQQWDDCYPAVDGIVPRERQHLIRLGIDMTTFGKLAPGRAATRQAWHIPDDAIVIGTASALRPRKRLGEFVEMVDELAKANPRVVGLIAGDAVKGDEAYKDQLLEQVRATGLGHRLQCLGNLEPIEPFVHAIDIFVSTSDYETFGNSVCEAMACGKPVAAYQGGSVGEVAGPAGLIVPTGDLPGLKAATARLVNDDALREQLGKVGRRRVAEEFDPARSLEKLKAVYAALP